MLIPEPSELSAKSYCLHLSLYSTAMQNTWCQWLALGNAPDARILRWRYQHVGIFWGYLTLKFASPPTSNLKFALPPMPTPDASQWNIGGVGPSGVGAGVGHVHFIFFCVDFICVWWSTQTQYPVEYGLKSSHAGQLIFYLYCNLIF